MCEDDISKLLQVWSVCQPTEAEIKVDGWPLEAQVLSTLVIAISARPELRMRLENAAGSWHGSVVQIVPGVLYSGSGDSAAVALLSAYLKWLESAEVEL